MEQDINQNVAATPESTEPVGTDESVQADTPTPEEYDVIKYNKEEIKIPVSERQTYLQKGYNYDKVYSQLEQTKQQAAYIERIAKMQGYDRSEDFLKAIDEMEQSRRIEAEASKLGIDTDTFKQYMEPMRQELDALKQEREQLQRSEMERQLDSEISRLKSEYPDFEQVQDNVFALAVDKGYTLEDAYILMTYKDKVKAAEQETLAKIADRDNRQVMSSIDKPGEMKIDPSNMTSEQITEISRRVQRGERITF